MPRKELKKKTKTETQIKVELAPPLHIEKKDAYLTFLQWFCTFRPQREPKTQKELADKIGVNENTLTEWKQSPEFRAAYLKILIPLLAEKTPDILHSWSYRLTQASTPKDIELWMELVHEWQRTLNLQMHSSEETKELLAIGKKILDEGIKIKKSS